MKKYSKYIIATTILILLVAALLLTWNHFRPLEAVPGQKSINVTVVHGDGTKNVFSFSTDADSLRAPLENAGLIAGEEGPFGVYIQTVDGESADETKQQWWCITKDGQETTVGADSIMIADGDRYELTLKEGW